MNHAFQSEHDDLEAFSQPFCNKNPAVSNWTSLGTRPCWVPLGSRQSPVPTFSELRQGDWNNESDLVGGLEHGFYFSIWLWINTY